MTNRKKVIIIGGGFGGINAAKALHKAPVDVLVLDKTNHHLFQPLLYQVASCALSPANIAAPIREILAKQLNTSVLMADVDSIHKEENYLLAYNGDRYDFDYLILAPGASHTYFGHDEWEEHAPSLKTIVDAITIREKLLLSFEMAERHPEKSQKFLRFVIIGGGPTGVEMAGAIAEMAYRSLFRNFRNINPELSEIYLVEGEKYVLPSYPHDLSIKAQKNLEQMGVKVLLNTFVTNITQDGVFLGEKFIECANILWAAGNKASSLLQSLNIPLDKCGRAIVTDDLSIPNYPNIFVIGDAAYLKDKQGEALPGVAPVAIQQGKYVAKLITEPSATRKPFRYRDKGSLATIGKAKAVGVMGRFHVSGYFAWAIWSLVHIFYLISFPSRIMVMLQWIFWYITNQRRVRLISKPLPDAIERYKSKTH